jgi:hypothetical protein
MPGLPAWKITPRGRRSIGELANALAPAGGSRLALLIGAGVDQAISGRPGWTNLLAGLGQELTMDDARIAALPRVAMDWPMETAEALRVSLGPDEFSQRLQDLLPSRKVTSASSNPLAMSIAGLVHNGVRVIVTLNYTDDLARTLRTAATSFRIRVIDTTELSAWPLGRLFEPAARELHIVKIHGSLPEERHSPSPGVLLDRSSYDSALTTGSAYLEILARLFEDFTVLSLGVSWTDVPLRDAAARVRRRLPVARSMHYASRQHSADGATDWWEERALTSAYGLRPLYYSDHAEVAELTADVANLVESSPPSSGASLTDIASWLDSVGDYESHQQSRWFAENWESTSEKIGAACRSKGLTADTWLACAKIERHLRHFIWFWLNPSKRKEYRSNLWNTIAESWDRLPSRERAGLWQDEGISGVLDWGPHSVEEAFRYRALIDFAIGAHEVMGGPSSAHAQVSRWIGRIEAVRRIDERTVTARRISAASRVWSSPATPDLVRAAQDACWEGIEAKVSLDLVQAAIAQEYRSGAFRSPRDLPGSLRHRLWIQCDHVRSLARVAGCTRREVGAVVLGSFLAPVDQAEGDLIAAYRRLGDLSGQHEPTAAWSIAIGLMALFADQARPRAMDHDLLTPLCEWLNDKCGTIPIDDTLLDVVTNNFASHWSGFHMRAANLAPQVARLLLRP